MKIKSISIVLMIIISLSLYAGGKKEPSENKKEGIENFVVGIQKLPATLEPGVEINVAMYRIGYNIFDKLIEFDYKNNTGLVGKLAESWEQIDDKTLLVNLRKGVKFHNGETFTAADVVATFSEERLMGDKPAVGRTSARKYWQNFKEIIVIDDYTVKFTTSKPDPVMAFRLTLPGYSIINKKAYEESDFQSWSFNPIGTGPYKIKEFIPSEYLLLEANKDYWGGVPAVETLMLKIVPETAARIAGLAAGDYHLITDVPPDLFKTIENQPDLEVVGGAISNIRVVYFNMNKPYFDVNLRRAMTLAIDRELIVETLWDGKTSVPNGVMYETYGDMYVKDHPRVMYDPDLAKKLLKDSVYNGEVIKFFIQNDYYTNEVNTSQILVEMWKAIGVNVEIEVKENWAQVNVVDENKIRVLGMRHSSKTGLYPDPVACLLRCSDDAREYGNWQADKFYELGAVLESSFDQKVRYEAFKEMLEIFDSNPPSLILYYNAIFYGKRKDVNWTPYEQYFMDFGPDNLKQ